MRFLKKRGFLKNWELCESSRKRSPELILHTNFPMLSDNTVANPVSSCSRWLHHLLAGPSGFCYLLRKLCHAEGVLGAWSCEKDTRVGQASGEGLTTWWHAHWWYRNFQSLSNMFSKQHEKKSFLNLSFDHLTLVSTAPHLLSITSWSGSKKAFRQYVVLWGSDHSLLSYAPSNFFLRARAHLCTHKMRGKQQKHLTIDAWVNQRSTRRPMQRPTWRMTSEQRASLEMNLIINNYNNYIVITITVNIRSASL